MASDDTPKRRHYYYFTVGVFEQQRSKSVRLLAYTIEYNPEWKGCCEHIVVAESGAEAKRMAMKEHRENCIKGAAMSTALRRIIDAQQKLLIAYRTGIHRTIVSALDKLEDARRALAKLEESTPD